MRRCQHLATRPVVHRRSRSGPRTSRLSGAGLGGDVEIEISVLQLPAACAPTRIDPREVSTHAVQWHIVETAMLAQVLHMPLPAAVERVVDGVVDPVEVQRQKAELVAQTDVEGWRGLAPGAVQPDLGKA